MDFIYLSFPALNWLNHQVVSTVISSELKCTLKADFLSGVNVKHVADVQTKMCCYILFISFLCDHPSIHLFF